VSAAGSVHSMDNREGSEMYPNEEEEEVTTNKENDDDYVKGLVLLKSI
jgi:hypothetical protein